MNPSDWRKAAALVTQNKQEATMAEMDQLSSMPPIVHYGMHMPVAASTPTGTDVHTQLTAGRFLSADYPSYPSGFIIPYFILT